MALSYFNQALVINNVDFGALYNKSLCLIRMNQYKEALDTINQALAINNGDLY